MRNKIVYILGAGFSAPLGLPVISDFLIRSKDLHAEYRERFGHFDTVFQEIRQMAPAKNYLQIDLSNIEQILSILEMEDYASDTSHRDAFTKYLADTIIALTPAISPPSQSPSIWPNELFTKDDKIRSYCYWLAGLLGIAVGKTSIDGILAFATAPDPRADYGIITLNYDLVLENCLELINNQVYPKGNLRFRKKVDEEGLPVAKLHGSVRPLTIVPPTWQKLAGPEVRDAWKLAARLLTEANEIRILGFSFPETDGYMKYLLSLGAMRAPHLKRLDVICLDPTGEVQGRYERFIPFSGFRYKPIDLKGYIANALVPPSTGVSRDGYPAIWFTGIEKHHRQVMGRFG